MTRTMRTLVLLPLLCVLPPPNLHGQYLDVKSLRGIDSLSVWVEFPAADTASVGINKQSLATMMTERLVAAGFSVTDSAPQHLYLNVNLLKAELSDIYACNIRLEVLQGAWLERTDEWTYGSTWFREYLGLYSREHLPLEIRRTASDLMEHFLQDSRAAGRGVPRK